ncbi:hypothetical protein AB1Y20_011938 [Prymnesium parvum]|uniref:VDE lipocalin domain-containing protein n=1 Tax=Prymnesium parvum TaxID=97485 RepID=A0AB34IM11_PRYPA
MRTPALPVQPHLTPPAHRAHTRMALPSRAASSRGVHAAWSAALQRGVAPLLAAALLLSAAPPSALAENELRALADGQFKSELVQPQCFATSCKRQTEACAQNGDCTKGLACTAKCLGDAQCTVGCFARYGNTVLDDVLQCTIEDAGCIKIATQPPGADSPLEAPPPPKALVKATPASMAGKWYKVMGWNPNYDCFDCQRNTFDAKLASNEGRAAGREVSVDIGSTGVDVEVEYSMPRARVGQPPQVFSSTLHETLQFDNTPGSRRTAHTEGKMFGLTFWENWYVIGQNTPKEPQFRFVYYTGKTLQNRYEGAFVYARTPELPRDAMPSIYRIAREAGMDPTRFCCVDNKCFTGQPENAPRPPLFTPVAEAAVVSPAARAWSPLDALPAPIKKLTVDAMEYLEDPAPFGQQLFGKQRQMYEVQEFDENGFRVPVQRRR